MIDRRQSWMIALAASIALTACQPSLRSDLPQGPMAEEAIALEQVTEASLASQLQPGDRINVRVFKEPDLSADNVLIGPAGNISLPLIGELEASGLSPTALGTAIEQAYGSRYLRKPLVTVMLSDSAPRSVSVEGEVRRPGAYPIAKGQTLLTALALAGSPTDTAKLDEVLVFRTVDGQRMGGRFDLVEIRAGRSPDPGMLPGDVVVVGFSAARGLYQDFLRTVPLIGLFTRF